MYPLYPGPTPKSVLSFRNIQVNCLGLDGQKWVWKQAGEGLSDRLVEETVKFGGGSVMMWGCLTWEEVGYAAKIDGRMGGDLYLQTLKDKLLDTLQHYGLHHPDIIFQQDNNPKHTCRKVKEWLEEQDFEAMGLSQKRTYRA